MLQMLRTMAVIPFIARIKIFQLCPFESNDHHRGLCVCYQSGLRHFVQTACGVGVRVLAQLKKCNASTVEA